MSANLPAGLDRDALLDVAEEMGESLSPLLLNHLGSL